MGNKRSNAREKALLKIKQHRNRDVAQLFEALRNGDRSALSRAITLVESQNPDHYEAGQQLVDQCIAVAGASFRLGITGVPGVGKSTFIETFGKWLIERGLRVAVLAIDPTSGKTGGSILGDKTRMEQLSREPHAFIRPSPTASTLGGVARKTREAITLCEAAGYDFIIVETVGVGQSETQVRSMCDFFLLLMLAGAGDELQGIKRGIMELADALVITKADKGNEDHAIKAAHAYRRALHLFPPNDNRWTPYVGIISSLKKQGIDGLWESISDFRKRYRENWIPVNRARQNREWFEQALLDGLHARLKQRDVAAFIKAQKAKVEQGNLSPFAAATEVIQKLF